MLYFWPQTRIQTTMLHDDLQDISQFSEEAQSILRHKILGVQPLMQVTVTPDLGDAFRIDLIRQSPTSWTLEKIAWKKTEDLRRLSDPLEKVKLLGKRSPTFVRESIPVANPVAKKIFYTLKQITARREEHYMEGPSKATEGILFQLNLDEDTGKELALEWRNTPQGWTLIPQLLQEIFHLSGIHE